MVGDYLFTDPDFISLIFTKSITVFERMYDKIKCLCRVSSVGSKEEGQLENCKRTFDEAYKRIVKAKV